MRKIRAFFASHGSWVLSRTAILLFVIYHKPLRRLPDALIESKNANQKRKKDFCHSLLGLAVFAPRIFFPAFISFLAGSRCSFAYIHSIFCCPRYTGLIFGLALSCLRSFVRLTLVLWPFGCCCCWCCESRSVGLHTHTSRRRPAHTHTQGDHKLS